MAVTIGSIASAEAAPITRTYNVSASNFIKFFGPEASPIAALLGAFTVSFDNAVDTQFSTQGISAIGLNLPLDGPLVFGYRVSDDRLILGTASNEFDTQYAESRFTSSNDFAIYIQNATTNPAISPIGVYYSNGAGTEFGALNADVSVSSVSAAPEPATWLLLIAGFGMVGTSLRRRNQSLAVTYS